jgi:hypothetical protein
MEFGLGPADGVPGVLHGHGRLRGRHVPGDVPNLFDAAGSEDPRA